MSQIRVDDGRLSIQSTCPAVRAVRLVKRPLRVETMVCITAMFKRWSSIFPDIEIDIDTDRDEARCCG